MNCMTLQISSISGYAPVLTSALIIASSITGALADELAHLPVQQDDKTLQLPSVPRTLCNWQDIAPDPERNMLTLSCQRTMWQVTETVKFNAFGRPWLATRRIKSDSIASSSYPYVAMANQFSRWNEAGQEQEVDAFDAAGHPIYLTIPVSRTRVFEQPGGKASADVYLKRGDRVQLLDSMPGWMRVSWEGDAGTEDHWIWVPDAFSLAAQVEHAVANGNTDLVLLTGVPGDGDVAGSLADIFPIMIINNGVQPKSLNHPELHLLFSDNEGWHFHAHSLHTRESMTINVGESAVLETGPITTEDGNEVLTDSMANGCDQVVKLFLPGLSPGKYSVRVVLTSPQLDVPLYSDEQAFRHTLPKVPVGIRHPAC